MGPVGALTVSSSADGAAHASAASPRRRDIDRMMDGVIRVVEFRSTVTAASKPEELHDIYSVVGR